MTFTKPEDNYYLQQSSRLSYRPLEQEDIPLWHPFFIDNPGLRFVGANADDLSPVEKSAKWINRQLERAENGEFGQLAVCLKDTGTFIGVGGIISREMHGNEDFEITYSLLQEHHGKGYATELARYFKSYAFNHLSTPSVISIIHTENEASMNVARKNGMLPVEETTFMDFPVYIFRANRPI